MPAEYQLRYLPVAQGDLLAIFDYIAQESPTRAESFVNRLDKAIGLLEAQPLLGRTPRHAQLRENGYRVLIVESYLVFYIIRNSRRRTTTAAKRQTQVIEIHRVVHGSRNLDHLF